MLDFHGFLYYITYCTLVLGQNTQNKPNGSLCALLRSEAEIGRIQALFNPRIRDARSQSYWRILFPAGFRSRDTLTSPTQISIVYIRNPPGA